ncbi:MAG TPA: urease accessory protein [Gammaproteobacteria bacterium]|nr:urease accessory protein [Gammaproteobacteria bacterium]
MPESSSILAILGLAFGLGLTHALDADHIMAVSSLSGSRASLRDTLHFCGRWAIGHGLTLLLIGSAVLLLGMALPAELSQLAEMAVGWVLVGLGLYVFWSLRRTQAHLHYHHHDGVARHAHWHQHDHLPASSDDHHSHRHHGAVMVGVLHGMAGSAPLLAILPLATQSSPWYGMAYLLMFCVGVLLAMLVFGGALGSVFGWLNRKGHTAVRLVRASVALGTITLGAYLITGYAA